MRSVINVLIYEFLKLVVLHYLSNVYNLATFSDKHMLGHPDTVVLVRLSLQLVE